MNIKPSTTLRNDYIQISQLAWTTGEPVYITNKGKSDIVVLSVEAFEAFEKAIAHRASILEVELERIAGAPSYSLEETRAMLKE